MIEMEEERLGYEKIIIEKKEGWKEEKVENRKIVEEYDEKKEMEEIEED